MVLESEEDPKRKLSASWKALLWAVKMAIIWGYIQLIGVGVLNWSNFDPHKTFSSVCRHFSLSYWWGGVLLASSG